VILPPYAPGVGPSVTDLQVRLSGHPFSAGWIGHNRIALWGQDGLGYINLRTQTVHPVASDATSALPTPYGAVGWNPENATGLALYGADGTLRFRTLGGRSVSSVQLLGPYVYARAGRRRFSVDLRNGRLTGPLASGAALIAPSLVPIP